MTVTDDPDSRGVTRAASWRVSRDVVVSLKFARFPRPLQAVAWRERGGLVLVLAEDLEREERRSAAHRALAGLRIHARGELSGPGRPLVSPPGGSGRLKQQSAPPATASEAP